MRSESSRCTGTGPARARHPHREARERSLAPPRQGVPRALSPRDADDSEAGTGHERVRALQLPQAPRERRRCAARSHRRLLERPLVRWLETTVPRPARARTTHREPPEHLAAVGRLAPVGSHRAVRSSGTAFHEGRDHQTTPRATLSPLRERPNAKANVRRLHREAACPPLDSPHAAGATKHVSRSKPNVAVCSPSLTRIASSAHRREGTPAQRERRSGRECEHRRRPHRARDAMNGPPALA
jgi:hypothetical protein